MYNKKKIDKVLNSYLANVENVNRRFAEHNDRLLILGERITNGVNSLKTEISHLSQKEAENKTTINMLIQALCGKYTKGTYIMYDEHNPREIVIIKDGKRINTSDASSVSFSWYSGEFPSLSIDKT